LAWSPKNNSGVSIIDSNHSLTKYGVCKSDDEIIDFIFSTIKTDNCLIAIDAPLIVPNETGRRPCEAQISNLFRTYHAGAHPSNRNRFLQWSPVVRGEELVKKLESIGIVHDPYIELYEESRKCFEVFPHPSMVVLFNLEKILKYKSKPGRDHEFLCNEFQKYQMHLKKLEKSNPALYLPEELTNKDLSELKGKKLKEYEDILDSVFCGYIALYAWNNPNKCKVFGDMEKGYILTPISNHMR